MTAQFIEIGLGKNLLPTIKEAYFADNLLIGSIGKLLQWSVSQEKLTKDYGVIVAGAIYSMVKTKDKNYLFLSDTKGCPK
jgi:WD40 repeat protein